MVKLSDLKPTDKVFVEVPCRIVDEFVEITTVEEILENIDSYKALRLYVAVIEHKASLDAKGMLNDAIEYEADNMYEDWDERIKEDITGEDIEDIQKVLDRILARSENIAYIAGEEIEIEGDKVNEH